MSDSTNCVLIIVETYDSPLSYESFLYGDVELPRLKLRRKNVVKTMWSTADKVHRVLYTATRIYVALSFNNAYDTPSARKYPVVDSANWDIVLRRRESVH